MDNYSAERRPPDPPAERVTDEGRVLYGVRLRTYFTTLAEFIPESEDTRCDCKCCTFRQFVLANEVSWVLADGSRGSFGESRVPMQDDCVYLVRDPVDPEKLTSVVRPFDAPPAGVLGFDYFGPWCYGDRGAPPVPEGVPGGQDPGGFSRYPTECFLTMEDEPKITVPLSSRWTWDWESMGVVYDRCHDYSIRMMKYLRWRDRGRVTAAGDVVYRAGFESGTPSGLDSDYVAVP